MLRSLKHLAVSGFQKRFSEGWGNLIPYPGKRILIVNSVEGGGREWQASQAQGITKKYEGYGESN